MRLGDSTYAVSMLLWRLTLSLVSVCISAMKSRSSLMYCLMHSMAAVVHCWRGGAESVYSLGGITAGLVFVSPLLYGADSNKNPSAKRLKVLPPAAWRSCASG